jgi:polysaccharide biosynthesis transport protein
MAENSDQIVHFNEYFKIIRNRLWVIFTILILTLVSGYYVTNYVLQKGYTATAQIQILPRDVVLTPGMMNPRTTGQFDPTDFQAEFEIMQSAQVLTPIITNLQLDRVWAKRFKSPQDALPMQEALDYMSKHMLKLDFSKGTNLINITVLDEDPKEAADIANAVADGYKNMRDHDAEQRTNQGTDALRQQIDQQQSVVDTTRNKVESLRKELASKGVDTSATGAGIGLVESDSAELEARKKDLLASEEDSNSRQVLYDSVANLPDDKFMSTLDGLKIEQADISSLRGDAMKLQTDKTNLLQGGFGEDNPRIQAMEAQLKATQDQITELIAGQRNAMKVEVSMAKARVTLLQDKVNALTKKVQDDTSSGLVPFRDAQREFEDQRSLLQALDVRLEQDKADASLQQSPVRIIARAEPPEFPSKPNKNLNYAVSGFAGLFIGISVAFLIEYLDTSVKTMADAETLLGLPVLTVIPNKGGPMPLIQDAGRLPYAEGYRILRAKLDLKVQNGIGPSLTMLSGGPGEGKSTTIYNLAMVCAQSGQSVILIDCDLRRPTMHELLNVSNERGLSNYLRGEGEAVSFVQPTAIPKLQVLTAGNMPMSEIGVLAGDKIRHMLDDLKARYDLVLIDAPPVLGISDGSIIAREVDYVILVIQHRRYPREISLRAKRAVEEVHGNCVGMVLNSVAVKSDDSYYYYSNYGNYYKKKSERKKNRKDLVPANGKPVALNGRKSDLESDEF